MTAESVCCRICRVPQVECPLRRIWHTFRLSDDTVVQLLGGNYFISVRRSSSVGGSLFWRQEIKIREGKDAREGRTFWTINWTLSFYSNPIYPPAIFFTLEFVSPCSFDDRPRSLLLAFPKVLFPHGSFITFLIYLFFLIYWIPTESGVYVCRKSSVRQCPMVWSRTRPSLEFRSLDLKRRKRIIFSCCLPPSLRITFRLLLLFFTFLSTFMHACKQPSATFGLEIVSPSASLVCVFLDYEIVRTLLHTESLLHDYSL